MSGSDRQYCYNPILKKEKSNNVKSSNRRRKRTEDEDRDVANEPPVFSDSWHSVLAPTSIQDLAVDIRRQKEIRDWLVSIYVDSELDEALAAPGQTIPRIAVIKGPAGSGKSITVRLVAQSLEVQIIEFVSKNDSDHILHHEEKDSHQPKVFEPSHTSKFDSFLMDNCRCKAMLSPDSKRLLLVEELPNVFVMDPGAFHTVLRRFVRIYPQHTPVAFIWTTSLNSTDSFRLFSTSISSELNFKTIVFNPVSNALLKKAIKRLPLSGRIPEDELQAIIASSAGDLRTLFNETEIRFNHTAISESTSSDSPIKPKKAKRDSSSSSQLAGRQLFKSTFHYLGKILYAKRIFTGDRTLTCDEVAKRKFSLLTNPDVLIRERTCSSNVLLLKLHQNYIKRTRRIQEVARCSELLSVAEMISRGDFMDNKPHFEDYAADISIRGLMHALPPTLVTSDGEIVFKDVSAGPALVLQRTLKFYACDIKYRNMKAVADDYLLHQSRLTGHSRSDLFRDILPFLCYPAHKQWLDRSPLNALVSEMARMSAGIGSDEDDNEGDDNGTSHIMQSNLVTSESSKVTNGETDERTRNLAQLFGRIRGLGENENPDDYEIEVDD